MVRLKVYAALGQVAGRTLDVDLPQPCALVDLLRGAAEKHGFVNHLFDEPGAIKQSYTVLINGTSMNYLDGLNTTIRDGDEIVVLAFVTGG